MARFRFRIVDPRERDVVAEFERELAACYARYRVAAAAGAPPAGPVRYLVVTDAPGGDRLLAGVRVHVRDAAHPLPLEHKLPDHPVVRDELARRAGGGVAELTGLWSAPEVARTGIGEWVIGAAVAAADALALAHMVSFAHQFNRFTRRVGFEPDARIAPVAYPDARYQSTVNWCATEAIATAEPATRDWILALRAQLGGRIAGELEVTP